MMKADRLCSRRLVPLHLWINQFVSIAGLTVRFVLRPKRLWLVELNIYVSIASRNLIIRPSSMNPKGSGHSTRATDRQAMPTS